MWGKIRAGLSQISPDRVEEQQHTVRVFELEGGLNIHVAQARSKEWKWCCRETADWGDMRTSFVRASRGWV